MSKRYWIALAAIGLAAFLAIAFIAFALTTTLQYRDQNERIRAEASDDQTHYADAREICGDGMPLAVRVECLLDAMDARYQREHQQADLNAQQDMAVWTFAMVWIGITGTILSLVGIGLLFETLRETRAVGLATQRIGNAQTRAYLTVSNALLLADGASVTIRLSCKNTGQSPANIGNIRGQITGAHAVGYRDINAVEAPVFKVILGDFGTSISAQSDGEVHITWTVNNFTEKAMALGELIQDIRSGGNFTARIVVHYADVFGVRNWVSVDVSRGNSPSEFGTLRRRADYEAGVSFTQNYYENNEN